VAAAQERRVRHLDSAANPRIMDLPQKEDLRTAYFLVQVGYTPEAWAAMVKNPQDRSAAVGPAVEKLGGRMERFWLSFGEYDIVGIVEMPNNVSAAAFAMAIGAGGACRTFKTTPLLTTEEGIEAMKQAATCGYKTAMAAGS
jgi:uncharacterized protein with GYD domain